MSGSTRHKQLRLFCRLDNRSHNPSEHMEMLLIERRNRWYVNEKSVTEARDVFIASVVSSCCSATECQLMVPAVCVRTAASHTVVILWIGLRPCEFTVVVLQTPLSACVSVSLRLRARACPHPRHNQMTCVCTCNDHARARNKGTRANIRWLTTSFGKLVGPNADHDMGHAHRVHSCRRICLTRGNMVPAQPMSWRSPLLLFKVMTRYICLTPPIWLSRPIIRQRRLIRPLLLLLLKTATSRICPSTVRLVIFTTELHRNLSRIVETVPPAGNVSM